MSADRRAKGLFWDRALKLVEGCSKISPGCDNCWSETETVMRSGHPNPKIQNRANMVLHASHFSGRAYPRHDNLDLPLRVKKPTVWAIWNDIYHEDVPDEFRDRAYAVMALCPQHTFLVLTKRAVRMAEYWSADRVVLGTRWHDARRYTKIGMTISAKNCGIWPVTGFPNIWHGVTAEDQQRADERIPHLLKVPGKRFLSIEPMLGAIDLSAYFGGPYYSANTGAGEPNYNFGINQAILGGESGKNARPMHPDWARSVRDQCAAAGVPFYFKQWGEWGYDRHDSETSRAKEHITIFPGLIAKRVGKKKAGRLLDGVLHDDLAWGA